MFSDLKFATRSLLKTPGFTLLAALTLAIGIGATTAMFSLVNAVLLRPLPYAEPAGLARIYTEIQTPDGVQPRFRAATNEFLALRRDSYSWASLDAWSASAANLLASEPVRVNAAAVTGNLIETLGVQPLLGRLLVPQDDELGGPLVALISYRLWQNAFGGDPAVVGRDLVLNGARHSIIGVMPERFAFPLGESFTVDVWTPIRIDPALPVYDHSVWMLGRLKPGVSLPQAQAELDALVAHADIGQRFPSSRSERAQSIRVRIARRGRARGAARAPHAVRRRLLPVADRVRERCELAAHARRSAATRDRRPQRARRGSAASRARVRDRGSAAVAARRRCGSAARERRVGNGRRHGCRHNSARDRRPRRRPSPAVRRRDGPCDRRTVRARAARARRQAQLARRDPHGGGRDNGRRESSAPAQCADRRTARARVDPARGHGTHAADILEPRARRRGIRYASSHDDGDLVAAVDLRRRSRANVLDAAPRARGGDSRRGACCDDLGAASCRARLRLGNRNRRLRARRRRADPRRPAPGRPSARDGRSLSSR